MKSDERCEIVGRSVTSTPNPTLIARCDCAASLESPDRRAPSAPTSARARATSATRSPSPPPRSRARRPAGRPSRGRATCCGRRRRPDLRQTSARRVAVVVKVRAERLLRLVAPRVGRRPTGELGRAARERRAAGERLAIIERSHALRRRVVHTNERPGCARRVRLTSSRKNGESASAAYATSAAGATPPYQRAPSSSTVCTYAWCAFRPAFCAARMNEYVPVRGRPTSTTAFHISSRSIGAAGSARQARARRGRARRDAVVV